MNPRHDLLRKIHATVFLSLGVLAASLPGQDAELTNYKSGIDVTWGGTKGTDYYEEYLFHDKIVYDAKVVYIRSTTPISMAHNSRNVRAVIGDVLEYLPVSQVGGDPGTIRYKLDRDRQYYYKFADRTAFTQTAQVLPAYTGPFTLASQTYADSGAPVVGSTGWVGDPADKLSYHRGIVDSFGDEWHVLSYGDDDNVQSRLDSAATGTLVQSDWYASDGKTVLLVVNPKTPCLTVRASGSGQFYTTPPKAYFTPKIVPQTTYFSGTVTVELRDINGNNVFYRINGGTYTNAGASTVTLNQDNFNSGTNTLEYYYAGNEAFVKTRTVVKDPTYPSAAEAHGNYLWGDANGYNAVLSRITREPYKQWYDSYRTRSTNAYTAQDGWDEKAGKGNRFNGANAGMNGSSKSLINAFVAKVAGFNTTISGKSKSFGQYAREMLLDNPRTIDNLGFEQLHTDDPIPSREVNYRGYYDANPMQDMAFAYDIMIANFKATQVTGGITAVEDYFIRDRMASFVYDAMIWSMDGNALGHPLMWGGARMMAATTIAMIMPEYSTPYYGTSGFGSVQTTYPLAPYQDDQLTWKAALFDGTAPRKGYPNFTWSNGISNNKSGSNIVLAEGDVIGGRSYPLGTWRDKASYFGYSLMGKHLSIWANMARMWGGGKSDSRLEVAFVRAFDGDLIGGVDPFPQTGRQYIFITLHNARWPHLVSTVSSLIKSLPDTDAKSDEKLMQSANIYGFAWYDDGISSPPPPPPPVEPPPVTPPPPVTTPPTTAQVTITVS